MHEVVAAIIRIGRSELPDAHVTRVERAHETSDRSALPRGIPALEEHAQRWTQFAAAGESAELQTQSEQPALRRQDACSPSVALSLSFRSASFIEAMP